MHYLSRMLANIPLLYTSLSATLIWSQRLPIVAA